MRHNFLRGQVSVETLTAALLMLVFFAAVLFYTNQLNDSTDIFSEAYHDRATCIRLAFVLSEAYSAGPGAHADYYLDSDANIFGTNRLVGVNGNYCPLLANISQDFLGLSKGNISIDTNKSGFVVVSS